MFFSSRRRHTSWPRDWSSDVCSSDLEANSYGIDVNELTLNFSKVQNRKEDIINRLHQGVQGLMKKGKIDVYNGIGRILGPSIFSPIPGTISIEIGRASCRERVSIRLLDVSLT